MIPLCHCKLTMFFDTEEATWLCPARFDGAHTKEKQEEWVQKQNQLSSTRAASGSLGGTKRAEVLIATQRSAMARAAARARWRKQT